MTQSAKLKLACRSIAAPIAMVLATLASVSAARAEMVLSQVIVDFKPGASQVQDIEVWNDGSERLYVAVEPAEIVNPGQPTEARRAEPDPAQLGLLVSPQRLVLEPDQRRIVRVAAIGEREARDKVYRVAIKPVAGRLEAETSALKILVGYDALVIVRPTALAGEVTATRQGRRMTLHNGSNTAQEIYAGAQCPPVGGYCHKLPAKRLYAGADWTIELPGEGPVEYLLTDGSKTRKAVF